MMFLYRITWLKLHWVLLSKTVKNTSAEGVQSVKQICDNFTNEVARVETLRVSVWLSDVVLGSCSTWKSEYKLSDVALSDNGLITRDICPLPCTKDSIKVSKVSKMRKPLPWGMVPYASPMYRRVNWAEWTRARYAWLTSVICNGSAKYQGILSWH
jgi:hypothetical protein